MKSVNHLHMFDSEIWKSEGKGAWHFITLPIEITKEIRKNYQDEEEGWGRLKVNAKAAKTSWQTSIWYDGKIGSYLLPIKSAVRKRKGISEGSFTSIEIRFSACDELMSL